MVVVNSFTLCIFVGTFKSKCYTVTSDPFLFNIVVCANKTCKISSLMLSLTKININIIVLTYSVLVHDSLFDRMLINQKRNYSGFLLQGNYRKPYNYIR